MTNLPISARSGHLQQQGISLVIVMILLVIIGVTTASAIRNATSSQLATNNVRKSNTAQQYAETALRYCEAQLQLADAARVPTLQAAVIPAVDLTVAGTQPAWQLPITWTGGPGGASATRTVVPVGTFTSAGTSSDTVTTAPECVVEIQTLPGSGVPFTVTVVTARGFSTDYRRGAGGVTTSGSVVWLQSILNL
jgi:type IV pilus assembly protein PilX